MYTSARMKKGGETDGGEKNAIRARMRFSPTARIWVIWKNTADSANTAATAELNLLNSPAGGDWARRGERGREEVSKDVKREGRKRKMKQKGGRGDNGDGWRRGRGEERWGETGEVEKKKGGGWEIYQRREGGEREKEKEGNRGKRDMGSRTRGEIERAHPLSVCRLPAAAAAHSWIVLPIGLTRKKRGWGVCNHHHHPHPPPPPPPPSSYSPSSSSSKGCCAAYFIISWH